MMKKKTKKIKKILSIVLTAVMCLQPTAAVFAQDISAHSQEAQNVIDNVIEMRVDGEASEFAYSDGVETPIVDITNSIEVVLNNAQYLSVLSDESLTEFQEEIDTLQDVYETLSEAQKDALAGSMESVRNAEISAEAAQGIVSNDEEPAHMFKIDGEVTTKENSFRYINGERIDEAIENAKIEAEQAIQIENAQAKTEQGEQEITITIQDTQDEESTGKLDANTEPQINHKEEAQEVASVESFNDDVTSEDVGVEKIQSEQTTREDNKTAQNDQKAGDVQEETSEEMGETTEDISRENDGNTAMNDNAEEDDGSNTNEKETSVVRMVKVESLSISNSRHQIQAEDAEKDAASQDDQSDIQKTKEDVTKPLSEKEEGENDAEDASAMTENNASNDAQDAIKIEERPEDGKNDSSEQQDNTKDEELLETQSFAVDLVPEAKEAESDKQHQPINKTGQSYPIEEIESKDTTINDEKDQEYDDLSEIIEEKYIAEEDGEDEVGEQRTAADTSGLNSIKFISHEDFEPIKVQQANASIIAVTDPSYTWGIDISEHQSVINWDQVKASGIKFVIIRCAYGSNYRDKYWKTNVAAVERLGIPWGVYLYSTAKTASAVDAEAALTLNMLDGHKPTLPVFYDLEDNSQVYLGAKTLTSFATRYCDKISAAGYKAGLYSGKYYFNTYLSGFNKSKYYLWVAAYGSNNGYAQTAYKPNVGEHMWQYTSTKVGVSGIPSTGLDMNLWYGALPKATTVQPTPTPTPTPTPSTGTGVTADDIVNIMAGWLGSTQGSARHKAIVDLYNSHRPLAQGYAVKYTDDWCDTTVSAAFIKANAVGLIGGTECGVERHINTFFKPAGIWIEDGTITPKRGDIITFNWNQSTQPNNGFADHIGIVESVSGNTITTIEGNTGSPSTVMRRTYTVGNGYIRGYARPKYANASQSVTSPTKSINEIAQEVLNGKWGNGNDRIARLTAAGYDPSKVQAEVNAILSGKTTTQTPTSTPVPTQTPAPANIKIAFNGNGATNGSMAKQTVQKAKTTALTENKFSKSGYAFTGWNTKANGTGTAYKNKQNIAITSDTTLYAQWTPNVLTINYYAGLATGDLNKRWDGKNNLMKTVKYEYDGDSFAKSGLPNTNGGTWNLTRNGYTVTNKFYVGTNESGQIISQGKNFAKVQDLAAALGLDLAAKSQSVNLYAQMVPNKYTLTVQYNTNGGTLKTGSGATRYRIQQNIMQISKDSGKTWTALTASSNDAQKIFNLHNIVTNTAYDGGVKRNGYHVAGTSAFNTKSNGTGIDINQQNGNTNEASAYRINGNKALTANTTVTLYVNWKPNTYTIQFNGNGATGGTMKNMSMTYGKDATLTKNAFTRTGYTFNGWNTQANGKGTSYNNQQVVKNLSSQNKASVTLYAQWKKQTSSTTYNGVNYAAVYDYAYYSSHNADLKQAYGSNKEAYIKHFVTKGMQEGRQASANFNVQKYKNTYSDLRNAFGNNLPAYYMHYINYGQKEGRIAN